MAYDDADGKVPALLKDAAEPCLEVHPDDAAPLGIADRGWAEARSRRGVMVARVRITPAIPRGTCFAPFHWGRLSGANQAANNLTNRAMDPLSHQPELKFTAINLRALSSENSAGLTSQSANATSPANAPETRSYGSRT